jgi:hypothetical protein
MHPQQQEKCINGRCKKLSSINSALLTGFVKQQAQRALLASPDIISAAINEINKGT